MRKRWAGGQPRSAARFQRQPVFAEQSPANQALGRRHRPDYLLIMIAVALVGIGLIVVYSISPGLAMTNSVSENYFVSRQLLAIGLGLLGFLICSFLPLRLLKASCKALVAAAFLAAVSVRFVGEEINGAYRWIQVGGLSFQVAELVKLALILWLSIFLVQRIRSGEMANSAKTLGPLLIVIGLIGLLVATPLIERDFGSSGVMVAILAVMAFSAGLPLKQIGLIAGVIMIGALVVVAGSSYRRERVATFLNPTQDYQAAGYQAYQAKIAVGSGGMFGLGLGKSVQGDGGYLPEAANDSIFAVLAEKFGFVGVSLVIGLYLVLFSRLKRIIAHTGDLFARLFVVGVLAWISTQTIINVGAMIGLLPLKGITLPLVSYGGTSLVFLMAALGVVFQISRYTSFAPVDGRQSERGRGNDYDHHARRGRQRRPHYAAAGSR